jgi:hypothetical protein
VLAVAALVALRPRDGEGPPPVRDAFERPAPPPGGAFATGGEPPPLSPEAERCFATELPRWVSALSLRADVEPAAEAFLESARAARLSAGALARIEELVRLGPTVSARTSGFAADNAAVADLVGAIDDELAAMGLGVMLDGDLVEVHGRRALVIMSFGVHEVWWLRGGDRRVRALRAHRLDDLGVSHNLHGFSRPGLRDGVVLIDEIDALAELTVEPALAPAAPLRMTIVPASGGFLELTAVERRAGELARAELGADPEAVAGALELAVARHEVRHRLDYGRDLGRAPREITLLAGSSGRGADRVHHEVRAYLAEVADDPATPRVGLALLARAAFDRAMWGSADALAAAILLGGLAPEVGLDGVAIVRLGEIDRSAAAKVFLAATERPPEELRKAARRLWERWFPDSLVPVVREPASL